MTIANQGEGGAPSATVTQTETINIDPGTSKPAPAPKSDEISMPKDAFNARLERERNSVLKELGVTDIEAVKKAIADSKAAEEAQKSDAERAAAAKAELERAKADLNESRETIAKVAKATLGGLSDAQRAAVLDAAGDDPAAQIRIVNAMRSTWAVSPKAAVQDIPPAAEPVKNTLPTQGAPNDKGASGSAPDPMAVFAELMKTNPYAGALYAEQQGLFKR